MSYDLYFMPTGNNIRVILLLEALGANYNKHIYNPFAGDKLDKKLNPTGKVPVLYDNEENVSLFESANILLHLCEKHDKEGKLLPVNTSERSQYLSWLFKIIGEFQTAKQVFITSVMTTKTQAEKDVFLSRAGKVFHQYLKSIEAQMAENNNGHLLGNSYNILDIALISVLFSFDSDLFPSLNGNDNKVLQSYLYSKKLVLETVDLSKYENLNLYVENLKKDEKLVKIIKADYDMWEK